MSLVRTYPLIAFFVLAYALAWSLECPFVFKEDGQGEGWDLGSGGASCGRSPGSSHSLLWRQSIRP